MRIIAGEFRRRLLASPKDGEKTRPIPDRVKESMFQLLRGHFENADVFDAFSGVGTIGLEALSRGARRVVMVERDRDIAGLLKDNIASLGVEDRTEIFVGDALGAGALARCPRPVHLVFFDPPYPMMREPIGYKRVMDQVSKTIDLLDDTGYAIVRTPWPMRHWVPDPDTVSPNSPVMNPDEWFREIALRRKRAKRNPPGSDWFDEAAPLREEEEDEFESPRRRTPRASKPHRPETGKARIPDHSDLAGDDEAPTPTEGEMAAAAAEFPDLPKPQGTWSDADLTMPNALGPETHAYHSMAVHLYMRRKL
jgi:16S rRNA (guanine966-N2)-methyltransferase